MCGTITDKRGMPRSIGPVENLAPFLCDFDPAQVRAKYGEDWKQLFRSIEAYFTPPGKMDINRPQNYWIIFCKGALSAAHFFARFSNVAEFDEFVEAFYHNVHTRSALPLVLSHEVFGLGFPLACLFLMDNGYNGYCKVDVHIDYIFKGIGLSNPKAGAYEVFKDVVHFANSIDEFPIVVDRLFWLIGGREAWLDKKPIKGDREAFVKQARLVPA